LVCFGNNDERKNALEKLKKKNADLIVLNSLNEKNAVLAAI
jgi:phosphopantothenoylcysteine synthetase/decarboxylase